MKNAYETEFHNLFMNRGRELDVIYFLEVLAEETPDYFIHLKKIVKFDYWISC